jgi:Ca2+-binding RTX toxin-like protein
MSSGNITTSNSLTATARPATGTIYYTFFNALPGYYSTIRPDYVTASPTGPLFNYANPNTGQPLANYFTPAERTIGEKVAFGTTAGSSVNGVLSIAQVVTSNFLPTTNLDLTKLGYGALDTPNNGVGGALTGDSNFLPQSAVQQLVRAYNYGRYTPANTPAGTLPPWASQAHEGDTWLLSSSRLQTDPYLFQRDMLHETLHGLGLSHTGEAGLSGVENTSKYSIMASLNHPGEARQAIELQLYDIASLQFLYGADNTEKSDDVYSVFGESFAPQGGAVALYDRIFSIWDGGGKDTIDSSILYSDKSAYIDLRPGHFSSIGPNAVGATDIKNNWTVTLTTDANGNKTLGTENISIAFGAFIENATGGAQNDVIIGNMFSNVINGGGGNDMLFGDGFGIAKADAILATPTGLIDDLYSTSRDANYGLIRKGLAPTAGSTPAAATVLDTIHGNDGNDLIVGSKGNNDLYGDAGDDIIIIQSALRIAHEDLFLKLMG